MKTLIRFTAIFVFYALLIPHAKAQQQSESTTQSQEAPAAASQGEAVEYQYEKPTLQNLSKLYWAISRNDIKNDTHIDNFMMINECDIYKNYYNNEFEWRHVREASRASIQANKKSFPTRFEFIQPLKLGEYNISKKRFDILPEYQIPATSRFEMLSSNYREPVCKETSDIEGYPPGIVLELSRPFVLNHLTVEPEIAESYINEKLKAFRSSKGYEFKDISSSRDAYIVMKFKIFASDGDVGLEQGATLAKVMGVLEGFEVYSTPERKNLLLSKTFTKKRIKNKPAEKADIKDSPAASDPVQKAAP